MRRGFTLLEGLLSMFFVMLLLGLFASLAHDFDQVLKHSAAKGETMTTLQLGLRRVLEDVRQAVPGSLSPAPGASAVELRLSRAGQPLEGWLPSVPPAAAWTPPTTVTRIRYFLAEGVLWREAGSPPSRQSVSQGLSAFRVSARAGGPNAVEVELTQEESKRTVVIRGLATVAGF